MRPHGFFGPQVRLLFSTHRTEQAVDVKEAFSLIVMRGPAPAKPAGTSTTSELQRVGHDAVRDVLLAQRS